MQDTRKYSHIIWDWNGTLFNDVQWCMDMMNRMLIDRGLKPLNGISDYHNRFCFPVKNYYASLGFDFKQEPFEELAAEYILLYNSEKTGNSKLNDNAVFVLEALRKKQVKQIILSASEIGILQSQMSEFGISHYFDEICALSDIYAKSKTDLGVDYIARNQIGRALLIGDTEHDFEVANALGVDCLLVAIGHLSKDKLSACGVPVLDDLFQVVEYLL
jgi:phosphoglycolate phosphatase